MLHGACTSQPAPRGRFEGGIDRCTRAAMRSPSAVISAIATAADPAFFPVRPGCFAPCTHIRGKHGDSILDRCRHPIHIRNLEGLNRRIKAIERVVCGFHGLECLAFKVNRHCQPIQQMADSEGNLISGLLDRASADSASPPADG